jgi:hypothetical protein
MKILLFEELKSLPQGIEEVVITRADCDKSIHFKKRFGDSLPESWALFELKNASTRCPALEYLEGFKVNVEQTPFVLLGGKVKMIGTFDEFAEWLKTYSKEKAGKEEERKKAEEKEKEKAKEREEEESLDFDRGSYWLN